MPGSARTGPAAGRAADNVMVNAANVMVNAANNFRTAAERTQRVCR
jgi:hypothetical protein